MSDSIIYQGRRKKLTLKIGNNKQLTLIKDRVYKIADYPVLQDKKVLDSIKRHGCFDYNPEKISLPNEGKKFLVIKYGGFGDIILLHTIMKNNPQNEYYFATLSKFKDILTAPNVFFVPENKLFYYNDIIDKVVDFQNIHLLINKMDFSYFDLFMKELSSKDVIKEDLEWEIPIDKHDREDFRIKYSAFLKRKKKIIMQFKGSSVLRSLPRKTMMEIITELQKQKFAILLVHDKEIKNCPNGVYQMYDVDYKKILTAMNFADIIFTMDSSLMWLSRCVKNQNQNMLFTIFGPTSPEHRSKGRLNSYNCLTNEVVEIDGEIGCDVCNEEMDKCKKRSPKCFTDVDSEFIIKEFNKSYEDFKKRIKK